MVARQAVVPSSALMSCADAVAMSGRRTAEPHIWMRGGRFLGTKKPRGLNLIISTFGARSTCGVGTPSGVRRYNIGASPGAVRSCGEPLALFHFSTNETVRGWHGGHVLWMCQNVGFGGFL